MADSTIYRSSMGGVTPATYAQLTTRGFQQPAPQSNPSAPLIRNGNTSILRGPNLQEDIPQGQPEMDMSQIPQVPNVTINPNDFSNNADQGDVGPKLPTKAPEMPKDPTNGVKEYSPEHVDKGHAAIDYGFQNNLPAPQTPVQAATQQADQDKLKEDLAKIAGSKNPKHAWQEVQKAPFYKDSNFYTGLMNTGLAIMSGANPMEAFKAGESAMNKGTMAQNMGANRQALLDAGYSPASVEAAIVSGDQSKLQMQQMSDEDRMQAQQANWANQQQYQQDLGQQQTTQANAEWDRRSAIGQQNALAQQAAQDKRAAQQQENTFNRQKAIIDYKNQIKTQQAQQQAASYDFGPKELNAEGRAGGYDSNKNWIDKAQTFDVANKDLQQAKEALNKDPQAARSAYQQALMNAVRGEIGVNRSIQPDDLAHFGADPSMFVRKGNEWSMKAGAAPTEDALKYLEDSVKTGLQSANQSINDFKARRIRSLVASKWDPKKATALVNRRAGGEWYDPLGAFDSESNSGGVSASQGALGGGDQLPGGFQY